MDKPEPIKAVTGRMKTVVRPTFQAWCEDCDKTLDECTCDEQGCANGTINRKRSPGQETLSE